MKIRSWLLIWVPVIIASTAVLITLTGFLLIKEVNDHWKDLYTNSVYEEILTMIRAEQDKAGIVVETLLRNEEIIKAFANKDREKLIEVVMPYHKLYAEKYDFSQLHFHTEDVVSFLRTSNLQKHGDDLKSFRLDIVQVRDTKKPIYSVSVGVMGPNIRYIAPIFFEGKYVGSLEANVNVSEGFARKFKGDTILRVFFDEKGKEVNLVTKSRPELDDFTSLFNIDDLLKGNPQRFIKDEFAYIALPIKDFQGKTFAAVFRRVNISEIVSQVNKSLTYQMVISAIAVLATLTFSLVIGRNIRRKLINLDSVMTKASQGELSLNLDSSGSDEFSLIGGKLLSVVEKIREVVSSSTLTADKVSSAIHSISSTIKNVDSEIRSITASLQEISALAESNSASIEETNAGIEEVAAGAQTAAKSASSAAEVATQTLDIANKASKELSQNANTLTSVAKEAEESLKIIERLVSSIQRVTGFVSTITSIADQTNLLALNAAIEAARAGELGRGFAVVAEEVRKLAEESSRAAKEISQLIGSLSKESEVAASAIRKSASDILSSSRSISNIASEISRIVERMKELSDAVQNIASVAEEQSASTEEMAAATDQISKDVIKIAENINSTSKAIENIAYSFTSLSKEGEELKELIASLNRALSFFKLSESKAIRPV